MNNRRPLPSQARLKELFDYQDGHLIWKTKTSKFSNIKIGSKAGNNNKGYLEVSIDGTSYRIHRLIYKLLKNEEPFRLDHHNQNKLDNRIENLRPASCSQNAANVEGYKGFKKSPKPNLKRPYQAFITINGKHKNLGYFDCPLMAHLAYQAAHIQHFQQYSPYYIE